MIELDEVKLNLEKTQLENQKLKEVLKELEDELQEKSINERHMKD